MFPHNIPRFLPPRACSNSYAFIVIYIAIRSPCEVAFKSHGVCDFISESHMGIWERCWKSYNEEGVARDECFVNKPCNQNPL